MDHEAVLRKYVAHVQASEGADYIESGNQDRDTRATFTDDEWRALERVAAELRAERERDRAAWLAANPPAPRMVSVTVDGEPVICTAYNQSEGWADVIVGAASAVALPGRSKSAIGDRAHSFDTQFGMVRRRYGRVVAHAEG